jgi:murein tripeptide amidase MpaA
MLAQCLVFGSWLVSGAVAHSGGAAPAHEDWTTPAEASQYRTTPRYDETMAYVRRLAAAAPRQVKLESFGRSGEGRELWAVVVSRDGLFDPAALRRAPGPRPVVLVQNAIHAGEMDGKDASLALMREIAVTKSLARLVDRAVLVIVTVYNVDGHERVSRYNRINQNGPEEMGWRTTSVNLNLNRDYMKADTVETRAFLRLFNRWQPDFFVDDHVSDGADYQYDTTYAFNAGPNVFPALADWLKQSFEPYLVKSVGEAGPVIGPYLTFVDPNDPARGALAASDTPRFSTGYLVLQNRPGLLVEMHMLKDYKTRVRGNYELLRAVLEVVNRDAEALVRINHEADAATIAAPRQPGTRVPLRAEATGRTELHSFLGYKSRQSLSEVSGALRVEYGKEPVTFTLPRQTELRVTHEVTVPAAYIVPAPWTAVIDVLGAHGLRLRRTTRPWSGEVETYRCETVSWSARPFEGRNVVALIDKLPLETSGAFVPAAEAGAPPGHCRPVREKLDFPAASVVVPMDQRAAKVAVHFLEPEAPDSAVAWGFFNAIFEQKEYAEPYVLEALARDMMARDEALRKEFEARVAGDPEFAKSPAARLDFFYRRSPFWDQRQGRYPVGRLLSLEGVPLGEDSR